MSQDTTLPPHFYLVLAPNEEEGVAFTSKREAEAIARRRSMPAGVPTIGDAFWDAYEDSSEFQIIEVQAIAAQAPQAATVKESLTPQQAQQAQGVPREWRSALRKVVFMARTSGGTTGPDSGLMAALSEAEALLSRPYLLAAAPQAEPQPEREPIPAMTWDQFKAASRVEFSEYGEDDTMDTATPDEIETAVRIVRLVERHHGIGTKGGE